MSMLNFPLLAFFYFTKRNPFQYFSSSEVIQKNQRQKLNILLNPFSANFTEWSNTLTQFVGNLPTNCLSVFDHFVGLALKGLKKREGIRQ